MYSHHQDRTMLARLSLAVLVPMFVASALFLLVSPGLAMADEWDVIDTSSSGFDNWSGSYDSGYDSSWNVIDTSSSGFDNWDTSYSGCYDCGGCTIYCDGEGYCEIYCGGDYDADVYCDYYCGDESYEVYEYGTTHYYDDYGTRYSYATPRYSAAPASVGYSSPGRVANSPAPSYSNYPSYASSPSRPASISVPNQPTFANQPRPSYQATPASNNTTITNIDNSITDNSFSYLDNSINDSFNNYNSNNTAVAIGSTGSTWGTVTPIASVSPGHTIAYVAPGPTYVAPTTYRAPVVRATAAYVALSQIPYTGFDYGPVGNTIYWISLTSIATAGAYLLIYFKGGALAFAGEMFTNSRREKEEEFVLPVLPAASEKKEIAVSTSDTMNISPKGIVINRNF